MQASVTTNYGYDAIYQLLSATQGATTTESYAYDPVGNRTSSLGVSSYSTNSSNQLTAMTGSTFTYDNNGNTLTKVAGSNTTTYAWDYENRLTSVTLPSGGGTVSFKYDPFGRRIYKSSSSATSVFAYDGDNLVEETNSSGTAVARYSQGLNIDEPLAMLRRSATSYYNADGLGSVTSLANASGRLAQTYTFDSFGKQTATSGSLTNPFQYTARESDPETGLYYYRARYYDAQIGRFTSEDLLAFVGGVDFYRYVSNRPLDFADPLGLCPTNDPCTIPNHPWYASVDVNILESASNGRAFQFFMVLPHMPWDYKQQGPYDDFGNFNFGATGAALGYTDAELLRGAGALKVLERRVRHQPNPPSLGSPLGAYPYGNEKQKQEMIRAGIDYYKNGCWFFFKNPV